MILELARTHRRKIIQTLIAALVSVLLDHASPWIIKDLLDLMTQSIDFKSVMWRLIVVTVLILISGWLGYTQRIAVAQMSRNIESKLRSQLFKNLLQQPKSFFDQEPTGDLIQRTVGDLEQVQELFGPAWLHLFRTALTLVISTVFIYLLSPTLALYSLIFFLSLALVSLKLMTLIYRGHRKTQAANAHLATSLRESLLGIDTLKTLGAEPWLSQRITRDSESLRQSLLRVNAISGAIWPTITLLCGVGIGVVLFGGINLVHQGQLSLGAFAATVLYLVRAQYPLVGLGIMVAVVQKGLASLDRVTELQKRMIVQSESWSIDSSVALEFKSLAVKNMHYTFSDGVHVLSDIHFELSPGKSIGIVGETGSGKSTLLKILSGVLPVPANSYWINDQEVSSLKHDQWKEILAYAPQDSFLFSWTIRDNLALGIPFSDQEIHRNIDLAGFENDLQEMPLGLDSLLGERGVNLSGGQRQRLGLARGLLHPHGILILDDVLSAVDPSTEKKIIQSLFLKHKNHGAILFVTHRYAALEHFDEVLVLDQGRIIERGSHQELMALKGQYYRNWNIQQQEKSHD